MLRAARRRRTSRARRGADSAGKGRAGALAAVVLLLALPAHAASEPELLRLRAERALAEGDCETALPLLARAAAQEPDDAEIPLLQGRCWLAQERYPEAAAALQRAESLAPGTEGLAMDLAIARTHAGDAAGAREALDRAAAQGADPALVDLYEGILLLRRAENREAALSFERARIGGPQRVEPVASYYAAVAWARLDERERAVAALERVIEQAPDSPWAEQARAALETADPPRPAWRPWNRPIWGGASVAYEYDDNVVLRGDAVPLAVGIDDEADSRVVWNADLGIELFRAGRWSGGVLGYYHGNAHFDLSEYDLQQVGGAAWLDYQLGRRTLGRLRYDLSHSWIDEDAFLLAHLATGSLEHDWGRRGITRGFAGLFVHEYDFEIEGADSDRIDRDALGTLVGFEHVLSRSWADLRGGYTFAVTATDGAEYDHSEHTFEAGARVPLPFELLLWADTAYVYRPFRNPSLFDDPTDPTTASGPDRRDHVWRAGVGLERPLWWGFTGEVRYRYTFNASNVETYDYDRHVVGVELSWRFD